MLHLWCRLSSMNVRKVAHCAQLLGQELPRTDAGLERWYACWLAMSADLGALDLPLSWLTGALS